MSQQNYLNIQDIEALLGPADDPVLRLLDQPSQDEEPSEDLQEEVLRQRAFWGSSSLTVLMAASAQESLLDDPVVLAALLMDEG